MEMYKLLGNLRTGHICLVVCCVFYLVWWSITFNPMKKFAALPKYILFTCTAAAGVAGLVILLNTLVKLPMERAHVSCILIAVLGIVVYAALLFITSHFMHRIVTTELFLIVGWTVLELCVLSGGYGAGAGTFAYAVVMAIVVAAAAVIGMICYLMYYDMEPVPAFYDGMVPLILFGVVMAAEVVLGKIG